MVIRFAFLTLLIVQVKSFSQLKQPYLSRHALNAREKIPIAVPERAPYVVGKDIPEEIRIQASIYDMILVERFPAPEKTASGLWTPVVEGKDRKHMAYVVSVPDGYGLESEQGRIQPIEKIAPFKAGDIVWVTDPWGIGPKEQRIGDRCFSFHKADHISAVVKRDHKP